MPLLIATIVVAFFLLVVWFLLRRSTEAKRASIASGESGGATSQVAVELGDRPRPVVKAFHVNGEVAEVTFDVPLPDDGADPVLKDLLVAEALEVVREKKHTLPIDQVSRVAAFAGRGSEPVKVGVVELPSRGELPPPIIAAPQLHLSHVGFDPIDAQFAETANVPTTVSRPSADTLGPIGGEIRLPKAVEVGLRGQGIEPAEMDSGILVSGLLRLFGYSILPGKSDNSYTATKGGKVTFVREVRHGADDYPELDEKDMRTFLVDFIDSKANRGMLVSDKYAPFSIYEMEKSEKRIRFVTRERLQQFVDSLALS